MPIEGSGPEKLIVGKKHLICKSLFNIMFKRQSVCNDRFLRPDFKREGMVILDYLQYPFDSRLLLEKKKAIKRELLSSQSMRLEKKIAILGGSTTAEIKNILELFLLHEGISPIFYESEYGQYFQDAMYNDALLEFSPDMIYIHTSTHNILEKPTPGLSSGQIDTLLDDCYTQFTLMWETLRQKFHCPIIQNNFQRPYYRLLGNMDISDVHGFSNFVYRLNGKFYDYAATHRGFYINDIDFLSSSYGLQQWSDPFFWHMYKYALCVPAIPELAFNVANIIKALLGKNKKAFALDLDNTLWGGVIGDEGVEGIRMGAELPQGQAYTHFQDYLKAHKALGVALCIASKNNHENAIAGLNHPDSVLRPEDFVSIKANWENKDQSILEMSEELSLGADSFVFVDDNPAERELVSSQIAGIAAPDIGKVENYIQRIDRGGYFEATTLSQDDLKRADMYKENARRASVRKNFDNYEDYLKSLDMVAVIGDFAHMYLARITQLTNKSNQFNLTSRRYTETEMQAVLEDKRYIRLCGRLSDKYGDNGIVSVIIGRVEADTLHIELWLMSCRVIKRQMEYAMFDALVAQCQKHGVKQMIGYYYQTPKNAMVRDFYGDMGFVKKQDEGVSSTWEYDILMHESRNQAIRMKAEKTKE